MKGSKEYKNWRKRLVKNFGKKNGVVKGCFFDDPIMERKEGMDKKIAIKNDVSWKNEINS